MKFDSLKNTAEFDFVYKNAPRFFHKNFVLYAHYLPHPNSRKLSKNHQRILRSICMRQSLFYLGLSISKKVGKAHVRNLIKRRVRAIMHEDGEQYAGYIFVFVAKNSIAETEFCTLKADLNYGISRLKKQNVDSPKRGCVVCG